MIDPFWHVIYQTSSSYNPDIKVVQSGEIRKLLVDGYTQSKSLSTDGTSGGYWDAFVSEEIVRRNPKKALILGLGAGTIIQLWNKKFPGLAIDVVEIDPVIVDVAKEFFAIAPSTNIIIGNASTKIQEIGHAYDIIVVDVYRGGDFDLTCESDTFISDLDQILAPNGLVLFNRIYSSSEKADHADFVERLSKKFKDIRSTQPKPELPSYNVIISASKQ